MVRLSLSLLGPFQVTLDGAPVTAFESDKVRALLAYLAVETDRPHRRERLAGLLWPERSDRDARNNLRYALSNLRKAIRDHAATGNPQAASPFLLISRQTIQFNSNSDAWVDVRAFANLLERPTPTVRELEEAVDLYRGEFLEGFSLGDSVPFEEWVLFKRESLCRQALSALHRLAAIYEVRGEYGRALPYAWRQVELEPWQEKGHRQLMRLLAFNGQRGAALAQYEVCRRSLAEELGVEPASETTRLYEQIRDGVAGPGLIADQALIHEMGKAKVTPPPPSSPVQPSRQGWQAASVRWALAGIVFLLLVVAVMQAVTLFGAISPGGPGPLPGNTIAPPEGKVVHLCDDTSPLQICVFETRAGKLTQVTDSLEFEEIGHLVWSPDGRQVVFDASSISNPTQPGIHQLYVINADGSGLRQVTGEDVSGDTASWSPVWAPDGEWIAFTRDRELWLIRPDGSEPRRLFGKSGELCVGEPSWSPNGQRLAVTSHECTPAARAEKVWVINRDGADPWAIHTFERRPDLAKVYWSHDGREIVCSHEYHGEEMGLLLIDASGAGEPYLIDELPFWWLPNYWPQWRREQ